MVPFPWPQRHTSHLHVSSAPFAVLTGQLLLGSRTSMLLDRGHCKAMARSVLSEIATVSIHTRHTVDTEERLVK